jgi:phosphate-selective porin OprO/OprP
MHGQLIERVRRLRQRSMATASNLHSNDRPRRAASLGLVAIKLALAFFLSLAGGLCAAQEIAPDAQSENDVAQMTPGNDEPEPSNVDVQRQLRQLQLDVTGLEDAEKTKKAADEKKPTTRWSAELQLDDYHFAQDANSIATVGDIPQGAAFRRARVAMLGDYSIAEYRLEVDFAQPGRPTFLDVWGAVKDLPVLGQVKVGNFFEPFGLERLTSNRYAPFMERNLPDQPFDPQRNPGIQASNQFTDLRGTSAIGAFRTRTDNFADSVTTVGGQSVTGRLTGLPYYDEPSGGRYYAHFGTAFSYRSTANQQVQFEAQPEARLGAAIPNVPFFVNTGTISARAFQLYGLETVASFGSLWVQSELYCVPVDRLDGPSPTFYGWYAQSGYFLTGEHKPYRRETATIDRVQPLGEFFRVRTNRGIATGYGAWEVATRVSHLDLNSQGIAGGRLTDFTVGLNWYLNPYLRVTSNYVHAFLDSPTNGVSGTDIFGMRMQFEY